MKTNLPSFETDLNSFYIQNNGLGGHSASRLTHAHSVNRFELLCVCDANR